MKKALIFITSLFMSCLSISLVSCGSSALIQSITANEEIVSLKLDDTILLSNYYTINSKSTLSAAERNCVATSSDDKVVVIEGRNARAVGAGNAQITITSSIDSKKTCSFKVKVTDVFIDRSLSYIPSEDDFSKEWDSETKTGSFRTSSVPDSNFYYIKGIDDLKWYVETDMTLHRHELSKDERWPKIGIVSRSLDSEGKESMSAFFLNADIGVNDIQDEDGNVIEKGADNGLWSSFGVCEVIQTGNIRHWAWEKGTSNADARHNDNAWSISPNIISYDMKVNLGVARDNLNYHIYLNHRYVGSYQLSEEMNISYENGKALPSNAGFFVFKSDATFANYSFTLAENEINQKIPASPIYTDFQDD